MAHFYVDRHILYIYGKIPWRVLLIYLMFTYIL